MTIKNKNDKRSQRGRSMVEMLGVLSIIGVLSVGGISAYSTAMKKHQANELMAATMQEAVLISAQLATGKTNPSLSSFNNSLFTSASTVTGTDNFNITLNTIDADVCEKMKSMLGVSSMVHTISDNCGEMTFHKNLTPKAVTQSGGNSGNSGEGGTTEPLQCQNGGSWNNNKCECINGYTGTLCETCEGLIDIDNICRSCNGLSLGEGYEAKSCGNCTNLIYDEEFEYCYQGPSDQ
jgi:Tfp pilus assembly protein PilE